MSKKYDTTVLKGASYSVDYNATASSYVNTNNYQSFANIEVGSLETFSGEIKKIKTYLKSRGTSNSVDYKLIGETDLTYDADVYYFTPDDYTYQVSVPTWAANDDLDFRVELYDINNNSSNEIIYLNNVNFEGSTIYSGSSTITGYLTKPSFVVSAKSDGTVSN